MLQQELQVSCSSLIKDDVEITCTHGDVTRKMEEFTDICDEVVSCQNSYCAEDDMSCQTSCCALYPCGVICDEVDISGDIMVEAEGTLECCDDCRDDGGDSDGDGVCSDMDNCTDYHNPKQTDVDNNGVGDICEQCTQTYCSDGRSCLLDSQCERTLTESTCRG